MKPLGYRFLLKHIALALFTVQAVAAATPQAAPLSGHARPVIEQFLLTQTAGLPGRVSLTIDTPTSGPLPPCDALEAFLPTGARLWGRVSVGVRCTASRPWTRYVPAHIAVVANYYVAARPIEAGQTLTPSDTAVREGDLTKLPGSVITNPDQLNGVIALNRIASEAPLRRELLRGVAVIRQGQNLKVLTRGAGFVASTEGKAMTDAAVGAVIQVRIQGGQLLSGVVRQDGTVEQAH